MKKLVTLILVFVMLAALTAAAAADEGSSKLVTLNWISARRAFLQNDLEGNFYEIPDFGMDIWIPNILTPMEEIDSDCYYVFTDKNNVVTIKVHRISVEGKTALSEIEKVVTDAGAISDGVFWINGYNALVYEVKATDTLATVIPFDDGDVIEFAFTPISNQDVYTLTSIVMSTIQPHKLGVEDVALMIDADLNSNWGPNRKVQYTDNEEGQSITVYLWDEGVTTETIDTDNWETIRQGKINIYNTYVDVLNEFNMGNDVVLSLLYISPEEEQSFLTISGGQIEYDFANKE